MRVLQSFFKQIANRIEREVNFIHNHHLYSFYWKNMHCKTTVWDDSLFRNCRKSKIVHKH